ncbi:protein disulfide-isomerase domain-containing protein [Trichophyton rubrum D6]|uniref:protein disulfide-isomerase n=4 Tax=Trichophyton TaxID=5550 RepID=A0A178EUT2_TRIRU|nr:protein disulfide-isomerase domain-containing protein [Trichophyton rubrum CBS 118892]EZF24124.1 protein disulfide-isomerase domain-containing protein [Trichophyton rubrum MR850]EZF43127.1 protein disulfide-isomerase domain-containing protein [Trichophyton rubrum CBS 100081]EZF53792.1 protein disulfide-isomerase domain-containing protein [Trichophyton rubrum CBS 288.86]EZF64414.1 protein disulfide-isomerase domain-containing protein [Trichophyton rubrum CBS 289.86]EZF75003.1 protein disulfi
MARLSYLLLASLSVFNGVLASKSAVLDLTPKNFDDVVLKSGKPGLVEFFAPWCGHCKNLAPVYEELGHAFGASSEKVFIAKVDADAHRPLGKRFGVQGFPTLKWFDGKSDKPEDYNGGRDLESLSEFVASKTGLKPRLKKAQLSEVVMLTDSTFDKTIGGDKDVFVAFTAPWCGHCKTLAPIWENLATDFILEPNVIVAKVDAEAENSKATAKANAVASYPTIKFFPRGSKEAVAYTGGRTEKDFIDFLNERCGTHREVGGGLNDKAGTIEALDAIVAKYISGTSFEPMVKEIKEAAGSLSAKYADYYVKAGNKLQENAEYAQKELARLQRILDKGNLTPEKIDDLVSRSNVLRRFVGEEKAKDEL